MLKRSDCEESNSSFEPASESGLLYTSLHSAKPQHVIKLHTHTYMCVCVCTHIYC